MSWDLLDVNNVERKLHRTPWPQNSAEFYRASKARQLELMDALYRPRYPRTPKADLSDHAGCCQDCKQTGGSCGGGLGFLNPVPEPDYYDWFPTFDWEWLNPIFPDYGGDVGGGGGGSLLQPDDCGRAPAHPSYGCPCGSMWSGDYLIGCINPCEEGWQVEYRTVRDAQGNISYVEECKPTATQPPDLVCPQGTVKNGAYCITPADGGTHTPVRPTQPGAGGGGGGGGASNPSPRTTPGTGTTPGRTPGQQDNAAALAQVQALCQRVGKQYDPQRRMCVGGVQMVGSTTQNPFGILQETVAGVPGWLLIPIGFLVFRALVK